MTKKTTLNEKVKLQHALKTEEGKDTEQHGSDVSRMMKLAGINKRLDANQEEGSVDFDGVFTGVANGSIPVGEGEYSFLNSLEEGKNKDVDEEEVDESKEEELDESKWWDEGANETERFRQLAGIKSEAFTEAASDEKVDEAKEWVKPWEKDDAEDEEVDESKEEELDEDTESYLANRDKAIKERIAAASNKEEIDETDDEELDEATLKELNRFRELSGLPPTQVNEYPDDHDDMNDYEDKLNTAVEMYNDGNDVGDIGSLLNIAPEEVEELLRYAGVLDSDRYDDSMDGDHDSAMASAGWGTDEDYGYQGESEMFSKGSLSRHMIEMIVDEMNKGKQAEEISEELSFDADHVSRVVEFVKSKYAPVNEDDDKSVDVDMDDEKEKDEHPHKPYDKDKDGDHDHKDHNLKAVEKGKDEEVDEGIARMMELSGITEKKSGYKKQ